MKRNSLFVRWLIDAYILAFLITYYLTILSTRNSTLHEISNIEKKLAQPINSTQKKLHDDQEVNKT